MLSSWFRGYVIQNNTMWLSVMLMSVISGPRKNRLLTPERNFTHFAQGMFGGLEQTWFHRRSGSHSCSCRTTRCYVKLFKNLYQGRKVSHSKLYVVTHRNPTWSLFIYELGFHRLYLLFLEHLGKQQWHTRQDCQIFFHLLLL